MLARYFVMAASAAVLVTAQVNGVPRPLGSGCTTMSFTIPSWFIHELHYSGDSMESGNATFGLLNRATNYTAEVTCRVGSSSSKNKCLITESSTQDTSIETSLKIFGTSAEVSVNQTWLCSDRAGTAPLSFTAAGSSSVGLKCTGGSEVKATHACGAVSSPLLIRGTLSSPVNIQPAYAEGPMGHDAPGCISAGENNPMWTLSSIHHVIQTGDGVNVIPYMGFNLVITHPVTGYQASCMPESYVYTPDNLVTVRCIGNEFGAIGGGRYSVQTAATFDPASYTFALNQTWYCDDVDPAKPIAITAVGSQVLPLDCATAPTDGFPNETTKTCTALEQVTLRGTHLFSRSLPPYSIEEPIPETDGCTISSILHPQWAFSSFSIVGNNDSSSPSTGAVSFEIILRTQNQGFQRPIVVSQGQALDESKQWYSCDIGPEGNLGQPLWPYACSLKYDAATRQLTIRADWRCTDLDPNNPVYFSGTATTTVNSPLTCETINGVWECVLAEPTYVWIADVSGVTWHADSKQ